MTCQPYIGAANEHALDPGHRYLEELEMDGLLEFAPRSERSETGAARRWAAPPVHSPEGEATRVTCL